MHTMGRYAWSEVGLFIGLLVVASIIGAFAGKFMNTWAQLITRVSFVNRSKLLEDEKKIEEEREKLMEEGGKLY